MRHIQNCVQDIDHELSERIVTNVVSNPGLISNNSNIKLGTQSKYGFKKAKSTNVDQASMQPAAFILNMKPHYKLNLVKQLLGVLRNLLAFVRQLIEASRLRS